MAEYGVKYRFRWNDEGGGDWRIDICQAGYTGDILPRAIGASSVSLRRDRNGNICGTSLELTAECRVDEEFAELYTTDPFEFKVLVYADGTCIWTGYITPELYSEPFIAPPYDVKVTASDNLGELKLTEWVGVGRLTFAQLLNTLLAQTGLSMGVKYISTLATGSISAQAFFSTVTINLDELSGKSYYDVLDQLLASFHAVIFQHGGSWVVLRETDVVPSISGGAVVPVGQSAGMPIRSLGSAYAGGLWPENHVDLTVEPAKKAISLICPELWNRYGTASITNPSTGNATGTLTATFAAADGINLNDSSTTSRYPLALNIEALRKNRSNKVYYDIVVKVQGNGVTRYLVENTDAAAGYAWQSSSASIKITPGDKLYYAGRGDVSASKSGEVTSIPFPNCDDITALTKIEVTLTSNTIATSYRPTRYLPSVYFFGVWISYDDQFTSLMDTIAINNNARGAASDVNLIASGLTDVALEKYFISNSLLDGSGSLLGAVHTSAFEGQDYISLLSRDYALSIAAPRLKAEGVFYGQERTDLPLFMSMGGLRYVIETWDWNLITGGVDFSALTLPAATISVTSETIVTGDNLGHGSSSGSGGSGGSSSSGAGYVAPGTGVPALTEAYIGTTRVQPSPTEGQDLTGIGNATLSGKLNLPQGAYLEVVNVGTTANPVYAIHTNIGIYSDSFISAFGASDTGGGGGGIDLSAMWANLQVNESGTTGYGLQIHPGHLTDALASSLANYVTLNSAQTISAVKTFSAGLALNTASSWSSSDRALYFATNGDDSILRYYNVDASTGLTYNPHTGALKAGSFVKRGGTSSQFLKADGSVDSSAYLTTATAADTYVKLNPGATEQTICSSIGSFVKGVVNLWRSSGDHYTFLGFSNGTTETYLGGIGFKSQSDHNLYRKDGGNYYKIWDEHNDGSGSGLDADLLDGQHGSYYATASSLGNYLPLAGGTMTGDLNLNYGSNLYVKFDVDTSRVRNGLIFLDTSDTTIGRLTMHNTAKAIYINATGAASIHVDEVGKYSLKIGENSLTYNTYDIYHTNNLTKSVVTGLIGSTTYAPYNADGYLPLSGGTMTGSPVLSNAVYLRANNAAGTDWNIMGLNSSNNLLIGYGTAGQGYETHLYGGSIDFHYGRARTVGMTLTSAGALVTTGNIILPNAVALQAYDTNGTAIGLINMGGSNQLRVGYQSAGAGYDSFLHGNNVYLTYGTSRTTGLTLNSDGQLVKANDTPYAAYDAGGTVRTLLSLNASNQCYIGYGVSQAGYNTYLCGNNVRIQYGTTPTVGFILNSSGNVGIGNTSPLGKLHVTGRGMFKVAGGAQLVIGNTSENQPAGSILFQSNPQSTEAGARNGFKIASEAESTSNSFSCQQLTFYRSRNTTSPYAPSWVAVMTISGRYNRVGIANTAPAYTLDVTGTIHSTVGIFSDGYVSAFGQSTTSDARLKKDFLDTTLTVDDIAHAPAITFLWKDREGKRQAGSLAQYWETVLPEVVTDIEGKKGLDYGAAALVSAITIARDVNDHEKRIRELERENRELKRRLGYADR